MIQHLDTFTFQVNILDASFNKGVALDFTKGLGPLTVAGAANASFTANARLQGTVGINLASLKSVLTGTGRCTNQWKIEERRSFFIDRWK